MKLKTTAICILSIKFFVIINGCSSNTDPQFRVRNEQLNKVNVNVQTTGSNKISINNIEPGQTTEYQKVSEGNITATDVVQNESASFIAAKNTRYTIVFSTTKTPSMQVDN